MMNLQFKKFFSSSMGLTMMGIAPTSSAWTFMDHITTSIIPTQYIEEENSNLVMAEGLRIVSSWARSKSGVCQ